MHAKVPNNSTDWGGWSSGGGAAVKPADQDNSWEVHATVQDNSTDWGVHHFLSYRNYFTQNHITVVTCLSKLHHNKST